MDTSTKGVGLDWLTDQTDRLIPAFQLPQHLDVYDIRTASHEVQLSVATLVGLINRPQPRIYLLGRDDDAFWLKEAFDSIPQTISSLANDAILKALLATYRSKLQGLIIYDPDFSDSINIATMLAGQQDAMIVSPEQAGELRQPPYELPLLADLRRYRWKSRIQAYRWAQQYLLKNANPRLIAGMNPDIAVAIRPFLVATRTFIYWLDPRNFLPNPWAGWMSELGLMRSILNALPPQVAHLGWFINEGTGVTLASKAAKLVFATDYMSNLEVWTSVQSSFPVAKPTLEEQRSESPAAKVYLSFTLSEGDNLQYIQERMLHLWRDPARGSLPIGWAISPALVEAAPGMAAYYAQTATAHDEFVAGPSGAGYMFPSRWPLTELPAFLQRTGQWMQRMNLTLLEVLDSNFLQSFSLTLRGLLKGSGMALIEQDLQRRFVQGLLPFGVRGLLSGAGQDRSSWSIISGVPVYQNTGIVSSVSEAIAAIKKAVEGKPRPYFLNVYVLAWTMTPSALQQVVQQLGDEYEVVSPGTLLAMLTEPSQ
jgi:hypothetical protein